MNPETSETYFKRCCAALGQSAQDGELVSRWCYDHPPHKALPKLEGDRSRNVYVSKRVHACLRALAPSMGNGQPLNSTDALADAFLVLYVREHAPDLWAMFDRHEQEQEKILAELRRNEPELERRA